MPSPPPDPDPEQPGWYRDPEDARRHRYWTGTTWRSQEDALRGDREPEDARDLTD